MMHCLLNLFDQIVLLFSNAYCQSFESFFIGLLTTVCGSMGKSSVNASTHFSESCSLFTILVGFQSIKKSVVLNRLKEIYTSANTTVDHVINVVNHTKKHKSVEKAEAFVESNKENENKNDEENNDQELKEKSAKKKKIEKKSRIYANNSMFFSILHSMT